MSRHEYLSGVICDVTGNLIFNRINDILEGELLPVLLWSCRVRVIYSCFFFDVATYS